MTTPEDRELKDIATVMAGVLAQAGYGGIALPGNPQIPRWEYIYKALAAERAKGFAAGREAAAKCATAFPASNDCECLGGADPETGVSECSLEARGGSCLCAVQVEEAERIQAKIRALEEPL